MNAVAISVDLILYSRMLSVATSRGAVLARIDDPTALPAPDGVDLVLVDWGNRAADWGDALVAWRGGDRNAPPRVLLYGPHTDLDAHRDAQAAQLGPMWARSRLLDKLTAIFEGRV